MKLHALLCANSPGDDFHLSARFDKENIARLEKEDGGATAWSARRSSGLRDMIDNHPRLSMIGGYATLWVVGTDQGRLLLPPHYTG